MFDRSPRLSYRPKQRQISRARCCRWSLPRYYSNNLRRRELLLKVKGLESDAHISVSIETFRVEDFFSELESLWPLERITNFVRLTRESFAESSCHLQQSCRLTFKIPLSIHNRFIG